MKGSAAQDGPERIQEDVRRKTFAPVYYIYGEDDFLIDEMTDALVKGAIGEGDRGFNFDVVDGSDADPRAVVTLASTFPMMSERRVVVVRNADKLSDPKAISSYLINPSGTTVLILTACDPDKRKTIHRLLGSSAAGVEIPRLYSSQIPAWVRKRGARQGLTIEEGACALLADFVGTDLREVQNEIEKLSVFAGGRRTITVEDVQAVSGMTREINLFELHHAMGVRDAGKAMEILDRLLEGGQPAIRIAVSLGFFYITARKLCDIRKRGGSDAELRQRPTALKDYQAAVAKYSEKELEDALIAIAEADEQLKSSPLSQKQVLQFMAGTILTGRGNSFQA
jgi:DNA polymerase-3 subunit delta